MVDVAIVIAAVFLVSIILAVVIGMLACQFCCDKHKKSKDNPELINSEGHKAVGQREVRSDGGFKYTPIRPMDTKPKEPRKIHDVEPDDSDVKKKKTDEIINKKNPNETIVMNKNGNVKKVSIKSNKNGKKKNKSKGLIKGQKVTIAQGPKGTTSPPLSPPTSPGQSLPTSPPSPKTSPSSSSKGKSPGTASNTTSDSAPEPTPISTKFENDAKLVDDKTLNPR